MDQFIDHAAQAVVITRHVVRCPNPQCELQQNARKGPKQTCVRCATVWDSTKRSTRRKAQC